MKLQKEFLIVIMAAVLLSCNEKKEYMDIIIYNANIYTVDENFTKAGSAAIKDGKFVAIGPGNEILDDYNAETILDLEGKYVYPGLIDPHCHFYGYGSSLRNADLVGANSFEQIIEIIDRKSVV